MKPFDEIIGSISKTILSDESTKAAFGQPMKLESITIVPVAKVKISAGGSGGGSGSGGSGKDEGGAAGLAKKLGGGGSGKGGGGIDVEVIPAGFIYEKDGVPTFVEIKIS